LSFTASDAITLLPIASRHNLEHLVSICENRILKSIDKHNAIPGLIYAYNNHFPQLLSILKFFVGNSLKKFHKKVEFKKIPEELKKHLEKMAENKTVSEKDAKKYLTQVQKEFIKEQFPFPI